MAKLVLLLEPQTTKTLKKLKQKRFHSLCYQTNGNATQCFFSELLLI